MQSFSSSFFIIFVIYETVFIISYCSLAAAGGLSSKGEEYATPMLWFQFKITRVFPYLLPCAPSTYSTSPSSSRLPHRFFVRSTRNSYSILSVGQGCCKLFNGLNGVSGRGVGGRARGLPELVAWCHSVCTIFLTSSQIWFLLFVVEFEMIMETFPMFFTSSLPLSHSLLFPGYNLHYALCWSTRIFGYGKFSGLVPLPLLPPIWIMQQQGWELYFVDNFSYSVSLVINEDSGYHNLRKSGVKY